MGVYIYLLTHSFYRMRVLTVLGSRDVATNKAGKLFPYLNVK